MNWPVMSHQRHSGYESMAREKCPCPTVVARAALLLRAEWIIQRCLSAWGETRTVGSGRATGASLAGACKLAKSYRTIICVQHLKHAGGLEEEKGKGKGREGDSNRPVSIFPRVSVAFFIIHANAEAALLCVCAALDRRDKLRTAHS